MEKIGDKLTLANLKNQSTDISDSRNTTLSIYQDTLTKECVKFQCAKILAAFKGLDTSFTNLLTESLMRNGFTDERLKDAVNHVIDNCIYPTPSIAEFVSFDRKCKVYNYDEMLKMDCGTKPFKKIRISADQKKPLWVLSSDFEKYGLKRFEWVTNKQA